MKIGLPMQLLAIGALLGTNAWLAAGEKPPSGFRAQDPGLRSGPAGGGSPIAGLSASEKKYFQLGLDDFIEIENAADGLGPRMNLDSCGGCHAQPAIGGTSPAVNPQIAFATKDGAGNVVPSFLSADGPIREVRLLRRSDGAPDGSVHGLFTLAGRADAMGCSIPQPDFETEFRRNNATFRIPTPVFGAGLIEQIPDSAIAANAGADLAYRRSLGIAGRANFIAVRNPVSGDGNLSGDATIGRFGWKAQNKSLLLFSGEAYNVEMGITNELFQTERDETDGCQFATTPNDVFDTDERKARNAVSGIELFSFFMRFLAPPTPSADQPGGAESIARGREAFARIGCNACHTPTLRTGNSTVAALRHKEVDLYSDLLLHDMGPGLADGVSQGQAGPQEFRTAPLWGLGQRIFFLHDGRTRDLRVAIEAHQSGFGSSSPGRPGGPSEANKVIGRFNATDEKVKQDLLNFLRSL